MLCLAFARRSADTCLIIGLRPLACGLGTPLFIDAPAPRGPQTPWSSERTPVRPPGRNPEEEPVGLLDLSAVFDTVDHSILIDRLRMINRRSVSVVQF